MEEPTDLEYEGQSSAEILVKDLENGVLGDVWWKDAAVTAHDAVAW